MTFIISPPSAYLLKLVNKYLLVLGKKGKLCKCNNFKNRWVKDYLFQAFLSRTTCLDQMSLDWGGWVSNSSSWLTAVPTPGLVHPAVAKLILSSPFLPWNCYTQSSLSPAYFYLDAVIRRYERMDVYLSRGHWGIAFQSWCTMLFDLNEDENRDKIRN